MSPVKNLPHPEFAGANETSDIFNAGAMREQLTRLVWASRVLGDKDKTAILDWLEKDQTSHDPKELQLRIDKFPEAEKSVERQVADYKTQIMEQIQKGVFSEQSAEAYAQWFHKELSYEERMKYLERKNTNLHDPKRKAVLEAYQKLPKAVRAEMKNEFFAADLQERQKLTSEAQKQHAALKAQFLQLPPEMQRKYRTQFKGIGLADRAKLLKSIAETGGAEKEKTPEQAEKQKLNAAYEAKLQQLVKDNLLSVLSKAAYQKWFAGLSAPEMRRYLAYDSDIDGRMKERKQKRDEFYALPEEIRKPHEIRFKNADLDKRIEILRTLNSSGRKDAVRYSDEAVKNTLRKTLNEKTLNQPRVLLTIMREARTLRRRAEIRYGAKKTDAMTRQAQARKNELDQHQVLYLTDLRQHNESRLHWKRLLLSKRGKGQEAVLNNVDCLDKQQRSVSAEQFEELVEHHQEQELRARLKNLAVEKLPNIDEQQLNKAVEKEDLTVELRTAIAA